MNEDIDKIVEYIVDSRTDITAKKAQEAEERYYKNALGTTDLAARGYRSYWD